MEKSLAAHHYYMDAEIENLSGKGMKAKAEDLYYYHVDRVRDFQHEREIHLYVTFFFSGLLLLVITGLLWVATLDAPGLFSIAMLLSALGLILFVTVIFYVRHYYQLENGVQKLYAITERLHQIIKN